MMSSDNWIGHIWGADMYPIQESNENILYYIPEEGGVRGSDTMAIFSGAQHPIAAHLFINHMLDARRQRRQHELHRLHGPERGGEGVHRPGDPRRPDVNPDQEIVAKLQELIDLGPELRDEYQKRWHQLGVELRVKDSAEPAPDRRRSLRRHGGKPPARPRSHSPPSGVLLSPASPGWSCSSSCRSG